MAVCSLLKNEWWRITIRKFLHFSAMHYQKNWNFSLFFLEKKSEIWNAFTYFENEKWNENALKSRSRMKSEMKRPWNRDREWKVKWKCLEIEIEKWNFKIILENSRETRLSQVTALPHPEIQSNPPVAPRRYVRLWCVIIMTFELTQPNLFCPIMTNSTKL